MNATLKMAAIGLALGAILTLGHGTQAAALTRTAMTPRTLAPFVQPIMPRPGSVVHAGSPGATIVAHIEANAPIKRVELRLDGASVTPALMGPDDSDQSLIYQPRHLTPGRHRVQVTVWDIAGGVARVAWSFFVRGARIPRHAR